MYNALHLALKLGFDGQDIPSVTDSYQFFLEEGLEIFTFHHLFQSPFDPLPVGGDIASNLP